MQLGVIGSGNMGVNLTRKLLRGNHDCVVFNSSPAAVEILLEENAQITFSLEKFIQHLPIPRIIWMMVPGRLMENLIVDLIPYLNAGDILVNGGDSYYMDDMAWAKKLEKNGVHYLDCGISGGQLGLEHGYRLLIGGDKTTVNKLTDVFSTLTHNASAETNERDEAIHFATGAHLGYLHCGPSGAGHFIKMIRNGIEYGLMAAYANGMIGSKRGKIHRQEPSAVYQNATCNSLNLRTIAKVWSRGSGYLDLMAAALLKQSYSPVFDQVIRKSSFVSSESNASKMNPARHSLKRNFRIKPSNSFYDQHDASWKEAEFTERMLAMISFEFSDHEETQSDNLLHRFMKHGYQKVCSDYQSVPNQ